MEIKKSRNKHVLYEEIKDLYERMDYGSLLIVYQHFARDPHDEYLRRRSDELYDIVGSEPVFIHDNEIAFFLLAKSDLLKRDVQQCLIEYMKRYPRLRVGGIDQESAYSIGRIIVRTDT